MQDNNIQKKNNVLPIITIVILLIIIAFLCLYSFTDVFNSLKPNNDNNETTKEQELTEDPSNNIQYINYTYLDNIPTTTQNKKLTLKIAEGNLTATINEELVPLEGIIGTPKSFIVGNTCGGRFRILVLTEDNKLYITHYETSYSEINKLVFHEINTTEEIKNITKYMHVGYTTCGEYDTAVVLKNDEIRLIGEDIIADNYYIIGSFDYSKVKTSIGMIVIYADNTISRVLTDNYNGENEEKISYNSEELKIEKYIETSQVTDTNIAKGYIISNNKLYELITKRINNDNPWQVNIEASLVNETEIVSETTDKSPRTQETPKYYICPYDENYTYYDDATTTITFKDGTKFKITKVNIVYNNK